MDCVSPVLDIAACLWDCGAKHTVYIRDLKENLDSLRTVVIDMKNLKEDVKTRVEIAKRQQLEPKFQVKGWLLSVEDKEKEVNEILRIGEAEIQKKCLGGFCPRNCRSSYKLGKMVKKQLDVVRELVNKGHFDEVADRLPIAPIVEKPVEDNIVGSESTFEEVWRCVEDERSGIIGIYGMGGVGKTTLLNKINNKFPNVSHSFELVIWVLVSKEPNLEKIQDIIGNKLRICDSSWKTKGEDEKATEIYNLLRRKRFVLLLDDLWSRLDLLKVGVPRTNGRSKVIFTTRSEEVCGQMEAHKRFKIECLSSEDALHLFNSKVGQEILNLHPEIPRLAKIVANECKGLPLALVTIGQAMSSRRHPQEWKHAIKVLQSYPSKLSGMGDHVFPILKFSYDSLSSEMMKSCFVYCCIFPEDHEIDKRNLIELWIGEGFLDEFSDIHDARNEGEFIVGSLKLACLLEAGDEEYAGTYVRMHDVIRDMAMWLACDEGKKEDKFVVQERAGLGYRRWERAVKMSLWGSSFTDLSRTPICPLLVTLIIRGTDLRKLPSEFFQCVTALQVLDLSCNRYLLELPYEGMDKLINLEYLDLSLTSIAELPKQVKKLTKLKYLLLDETLISPTEVISCVSSLQLYSMVSSPLALTRADNEIRGDNVLLVELECLDHINELRITLCSIEAICYLFNSTKLQSCISHLVLAQSPYLSSVDMTSSIFKRMERLETFEIIKCESSEMNIIADDCEEHISLLWEQQYFHNLIRVKILDCDNVKDTSWLIHAPTLQHLELGMLPSIVEVISDVKSGGIEDRKTKIFPYLRALHLHGLPKLEIICNRTLSCPSLLVVDVFDCPRLTKLPFNSDSGAKNSLKVITGPSKWWEALQWENLATYDIFSSKYKDSLF